MESKKLTIIVNDINILINSFKETFRPEFEKNSKNRKMYVFVIERGFNSIFIGRGDVFSTTIIFNFTDIDEYEVHIIISGGQPRITYPSMIWMRRFRKVFKALYLFFLNNTEVLDIKRKIYIYDDMGKIVEIKRADFFSNEIYLIKDGYQPYIWIGANISKEKKNLIKQTSYNLDFESYIGEDIKITDEGHEDKILLLIMDSLKKEFLKL